MSKLVDAIGLMSGTSMDGVDAALLATNGKFSIQPLGNCALPYDREFQCLLKATEYAVYQSRGNLYKADQRFQLLLTQYIQHCIKADDPQQYLDELTKYFHHATQQSLSIRHIIKHSTELHAKATKKLLNKVNLSAKQIKLLGYHGQTVYHAPKQKLTVQLGDKTLLEALTNIKVVNNFRQNDINNGGQGAPLAPIYHQALAVRDHLIPCAIVNCGGIANVTFVNSKNTDDLIGFDTGPGNTLIDQFIRLKTSGKEPFDQNGYYGSQGMVHEKILNQLLEQQKKYLNKKPPKSLDTHHLSLIASAQRLELNDGCATLAAFTAKTIAHSIQFNITQNITRWILCGGGGENPVITKKLRSYLKQTISDAELIHSNDIGWSTQNLEAELIAYLAVRIQRKLPISFFTTTGIRHSQKKKQTI